MTDSALARLTTVDAVLLPPHHVDQKCISVSSQLGRYGTEFTLNEGRFYPHLSLYMADIDDADIGPAEQRLIEIAKDTAPVPLTAQRYLQDTEQGMIEVAYANTQPVTRLQERLLAALAPLRRRLRRRDPVGRDLPAWLPTTTGETRRNLEQYGYDEIGGLFRPHITFTRFVQRDLVIDVAELPPLGEFDASFSRLGLFEMGDHGTCIRSLVELELAG